MQYYDYDDHGNLIIIEMGDPYIGGGDDGDVQETTTSFHDHGHGPATSDIPWWYSSANSQYGPTATATVTATDGSGSGGSGSTQTTAAAQLASTPIQSFGSFTTSITSPASENVGSYSTSQTTAAPSSSPSSNPSSAQSSPSSSGPPPGPDQFHTAKLAVAVIVPLVVLLFGAIAFLVMRRRKRQQFQQKQTREMSMQPPTYPSAPEYSFIPQPPPTIPSGTSPMVPPIIIAPMSAGSNSGYMTGMDTSDAVSVRDASPAYNGYASVEDSEEPPPPYRPRSLAPASRNSSVRHPPVADGFYGTHLMAGQNQTHENPFEDPEASIPVANGRSPFADPGDNDDDVSDISDVEEGHDMRRRNLEVLSDVSDLSYQHEFHSLEDRINR